jgi:hypothetical protein
LNCENGDPIVSAKNSPRNNATGAVTNDVKHISANTRYIVRLNSC